MTRLLNTIGVTLIAGSLSIVSACGLSDPPDTAPSAAGPPSATETIEQASCAPAPPVIVASNKVGECNEGQAAIFLDPQVRAACDLTPQTSFSLRGDAIRDPHTYDYGTHQVVITARDDIANTSATRTVGVEVRDSLSPIVNAGPDRTVECTSLEGTEVQANRPSVTDTCDPEPRVLVQGPEGMRFGLGQTQVRVTATDASGNRGSDSYTVVVRDTTAPTLEAGPSLIVPARGDCNHDNRGPGTGTLVTMATPQVSDACTRHQDIVVFNDFNETSNPVICAPNPGNILVRWTAIDAAGQRTTDLVGIEVVNSNLPIEVTSERPRGFTNDAVTVAVSADNGVAPIQWQMLGGVAPTEAPGNATEAQATFTRDSVYCPLYIVAIDAEGERGANNNLCFGIEHTPPSGLYQAIPRRFIDPDNPNAEVDVDPDDEDTWPIFFSGEHIRAEVSASDVEGSVRSGVARVELIVDPDSEQPRALIDARQQTSGEPARGPEHVSVLGCNTQDEACREDRQIELGDLGIGAHTMMLRVTDAAGNTSVQTFHFHVRNFDGALSRLEAWTAGLTQHSPLRTRQHLNKAQTLLASGARLFSTTPGYAFLISQRAMRRLDDAERDGANVSRIKQFIARAISAEVNRLVHFTELRRFGNWEVLGGQGTYTRRPLLTGRDDLYTVEVQPTVELARGFAHESLMDYEQGRYESSVTSAIRAFDGMAILFNDQTLAQAFDREPFMTEGNRPEAILRGSLPGEYGLPIAITLRQQIERVAQEQGVPNDVIEDLNRVRELMTVFEEGVAAVGSLNFTNGYLTENVYLSALEALERFDAMQDSHVYTHYWRAAIVYVLAYVTNFSLYQGPTSLINQFGQQANEDPRVQVSECRFDRAMQALTDGRLIDGVVTASQEFRRSKCLVLEIYNDYYPGHLQRELPIDPTLYGCTREPVVVDPAAECPCGLGQEIENETDSLCDGIDGDCDGQVDEGYVPETCGNGGCARQSRCINGQVVPCVPGEPLSTTDPTCDGIDDDCDGQTDEDYNPTGCGQFGCQAFSACEGGQERACEPLTPQREVCDGRDNNCDGRIDEGLDNDRDGYSEGEGGECRHGDGDCDDTDPLVNPGALEVCDGRDNNCDGRIDEGVLNACGGCDPRCSLTRYGVGDGRLPFNPTPSNSNNTDTDDLGQIRLATDNVDAAFAWFVSSYGSTANQMFKVDTHTGNQVGRYPTGSNPSRTTIDDQGNVFVANRSSANLTKIANWTPACERDLRNCECRDRNNNGRIDTSNDSNGNGKIDNNEYLGTADECYLWTTPRGSLERLPRSLAIDAQGFVWVGNWANQPRMYKIHPDTGVTLLAIRISIRTYGSVIDRNGILWFVDRNTRVQGINTANGSVTPVYRGASGQSYGIALNNDYIFIGSAWSPYLVRVFDPSRRQVLAGPVNGGFRKNSRGLTVQSDGVTICSTHWTNPYRYVQCWQINDRNNDGTPQVSEYTRTKDVYLRDCYGVLGIGVGANDVNWVSCYYRSSTAAFSPDPNVSTVNYHAVGTYPYTYSDFTGNIRSTFTAPRGNYAQIFNGCPASRVESWDKVRWGGTVPDNSSIQVFVSVANSRDGLEAADEDGPYTAREIDLSGLPSQAWMKVRFKLESNENGVVPKVGHLDVSRFCALDLNDNR